MKYKALQFELPIDTKLTLSLAERAEWRDKVAASVADRFSKKFQRGQCEHGGDLGELPIDQLLDELEMEALDMLAYVYELRRKLGKETI